MNPREQIRRIVRTAAVVGPLTAAAITGSGAPQEVFAQAPQRYQAPAISGEKIAVTQIIELSPTHFAQESNGDQIGTDNSCSVGESSDASCGCSACYSAPTEYGGGNDGGGEFYDPEHDNPSPGVKEGKTE